MRTIHLACGLTVLCAAPGGSVTSGGARFAIAEADGDTIIETAPSKSMAAARASEIAAKRIMCESSDL